MQKTTKNAIILFQHERKLHYLHNRANKINNLQKHVSFTFSISSYIDIIYVSAL